MLNKIKSIYSVITLIFIGVALVLFLNGNSTSNLLFQTQSNSEEKVSPPINTTDSFKCGTMDIYNKIIKENPDFKRRQQEIEIFTKNYIKNLKPGLRTVVKVPVVVHVVYKTPEQNISNAEIQSQIDVLNIDYRRLNEDTVNTPPPFKPLGGDTQIEFELAKRDPLGNPSIGITRTQTTVDTFYMDNHVKYTALGGHDIWDREEYLNLWICNLYFMGGYSSFPGYPADIDGVVINYQVFGTIGITYPSHTKGRIATHEIGHWFNLWHIWGDAYCGNDYVDDTPTQQAENYSCPTFPHVTCSNGPNGDMFMNYMDYTRDDCKNIFTKGQSDRMNAAIYGVRTGLPHSNGGIHVSGVPIAHFRSDKMTINFGENINFFDESGGIPYAWQWTFTGGIPSTSNQQNPNVTFPDSGLYSVNLKVLNSYGMDSVNYVNYVKVLGAVGINVISSSVLGEFKLFQNYPNPFNPVTKIRFDIAKKEDRIQNSEVKLKIYDITGREIITLVNEQLKPGTYEVGWDASQYTSGVYFYRLTAGEFTDTKRMLMIK
jgi:PKD repeat protein